VELEELGHQANGKIVHAIMARVFEGPESGSPAGPGKTGNHDDMEVCHVFTSTANRTFDLRKTTGNGRAHQATNNTRLTVPALDPLTPDSLQRKMPER
jgi:hypothetical protein